MAGWNCKLETLNVATRMLRQAFELMDTRVAINRKAQARGIVGLGDPSAVLIRLKRIVTAEYDGAFHFDDNVRVCCTHLM